MGLGSSIQKDSSMSDDMKKFVNDQITNNKIMIFSKSSCPFCKIAKSAFNELDAKYEVVELNRHPNGDEIQDILHQMTGSRSVPRVFINGECIGGGTETKDLLKSGKLRQMIDA